MSFDASSRMNEAWVTKTCGPLIGNISKYDLEDSTSPRSDALLSGLQGLVRSHLDGEDFEIDGSYNLKFSQCVDLKTYDEDLFDEDLVDYVQAGQVVSTASYVLFHVCQGDDCYYEAEDDLYVIDLATYLTNVATYHANKRNDYCEQCEDFDDYCNAEEDEEDEEDEDEDEDEDGDGDGDEDEEEEDADEEEDGDEDDGDADGDEEEDEDGDGGEEEEDADEGGDEGEVLLMSAFYSQQGNDRRGKVTS